jgi:hypothetical protein
LKDQQFRGESKRSRNPFSRRNYPREIGFNKAEDRYAFGGSSDAVLAFI